MSCQTKTTAVSRVAQKSGIAGQSNLAAGLTGQNKQIMISDVRYANGSGRYIVIREGSRESGRMVPLKGQTIDITGPSQIVSTPDGAWWITTPASIEGLFGNGGQQTAQKRRSGSGQKTRLVSEAIRQKKQIQIDYRTAKGKQRYTLVPLDVRPGQKKYKNHRFLIGYSEQERKVRRLRLDRVTSIKVSQAAFNPEEASAKLGPDKKKREWYLPREWAAKSTESAEKILNQASTQFEALDWQIDDNLVRILDLNPGRRPGAARAVLKQLKDAGYKISPDHPSKSTLPFWRTMYQEGFIDDRPDTLPTREEAMAELE